MQKKLIITLIWVVLLALNCQKKDTIYPAINDTAFDNGSNIIFPELDNQIIDDLELLGKLWGFLKYHHPEIGKGNYNWDYELFRVLPDYLKVTDKKQRDQLLLSWINKYGEIPVCKRGKKTSKKVFIKPDLSWIENSDADNALKDKVKEIYQNRHQGRHYYISMTPMVGNPKFNNENLYSNMPFPDEGFRLLALYRYWNTINYFFPYKYMTDKNWDDVLKEYIPIFINVKDELEYELAVAQLIGEICDTHGFLLEFDQIQKIKGNKDAPFVVKFIENKLVVTDYFKPELAEKAKLQKGDIITHISGKPVEKIVDSLKKYYPASNEAARLRNMAHNLLRSNSSIIDIKYISDGQSKESTLKLYNSYYLNMEEYWNKGVDEKCYKLLDDNIGYITLKAIKNDDIKEIKNSFKNTKGIIIDIRNYPSTFVPFKLGTYFLKKRTPFVKFTIGSVNNPGQFRFTGPLYISKSKNYYQGKLVVLVNEDTQSQAEYTAMAFKASPNTTIMGSTTAGADGNVSIISLPGGLKTYISGIGIYYPDGTKTQRVGIVPDIYIEPTIEGIKSGRDELLEKAIEFINK
ncbi:MAG: S41 family peptidase [Bacteroidetes bacterium]|nr:S41 family peptidase [Bacteroidota bacterium]MCL2303593.1 S41 family peptidase [Lentimicrobiaceae bacterium]